MVPSFLNRFIRPFSSSSVAPIGIGMSLPPVVEKATVCFLYDAPHLASPRFDANTMQGCCWVTAQIRSLNNYGAPQFAMADPLLRQLLLGC